MEGKRKEIELQNGCKMPIVGLGTFLPKEGEEQILYDSIVYAVVEWGYRLIDTACYYENEEIVGWALQECFERGVKREDIFITTKLRDKDSANVQEALKESLKKLQVDYVDLYLIHWMITDVDFENWVIKGPPLHQVWKDMEELVEQGLIKSIGVSNCSVMMLINLLAGSKIKPVNNQIENNPYLSQNELVLFCQKFGVSITAYAPIGSPLRTNNNLINDEVIEEIAEKHNANPGQIALAWNISRGVGVIPKSISKERIKSNIEAQNIQLDEEDIERINALNWNKRSFDPETNKAFNEWHNLPYFR